MGRDTQRHQTHPACFWIRVLIAVRCIRPLPSNVSTCLAQGAKRGGWVLQMDTKGWLVYGVDNDGSMLFLGILPTKQQADK
jgi:hypothetical protein